MAEVKTRNYGRLIVRTPELINELYTKQQGKCSICGQHMDKSKLGHYRYVEINHNHDYSDGGTSTKRNISLAHGHCNHEKGAIIGNDVKWHGKKVKVKRPYD